MFLLLNTAIVSNAWQQANPYRRYLGIGGGLTGVSAVTTGDPLLGISAVTQLGAFLTAGAKVGTLAARLGRFLIPGAGILCAIQAVVGLFQLPSQIQEEGVGVSTAIHVAGIAAGFYGMAPFGTWGTIGRATAAAKGSAMTLSAGKKVKDVAQLESAIAKASKEVGKDIKSVNIYLKGAGKELKAMDKEILQFAGKNKIAGVTSGFDDAALKTARDQLRRQVENSTKKQLAENTKKLQQFEEMVTRRKLLNRGIENARNVRTQLQAVQQRLGQHSTTPVTLSEFNSNQFTLNGTVHNFSLRSRLSSNAEDYTKVMTRWTYDDKKLAKGVSKVLARAA